MKMISRRDVAGRGYAGPFPAPTGRAWRAPIGLGDLAWRIAHPIAHLVDRFGRPRLQSLGVWRPGFRLTTCGACSRRRALYNRLLPDIASWAAWRALPGLLLAHLRAGGLPFRGPRKSPAAALHDR